MFDFTEFLKNNVLHREKIIKIESSDLVWRICHSNIMLFCWSGNEVILMVLINSSNDEGYLSKNWIKCRIWEIGLAL